MAAFRFIMENDLESRWEALCGRIGADLDGSTPGVLFHNLLALYEFPPRSYHNLSHIDHCLVVLDRFHDIARNADAIEMAIYVHDCVYDVTRKDNERRSAEVAVMYCVWLGADEAFTETVWRLVMATAHPSEPETNDERLMADVDLSILGSSWETYADYLAAIRSEFGFASDAEFESGREQFLRQMLQRDRLYHTEPVSQALEARARSNMRRELNG